MLGLAMTMVMAPTGQASAHRLCPMHLYPLTMTACPPSMASTSPSGQTVVHVAQPMQYCVSICGCWDCGPSERKRPLFRGLVGAGLPELLLLEVPAHEKQRNDSGDDETDEIIHTDIFS